MEFVSKKGRTWVATDKPAAVQQEMTLGRSVVHAIAFRGIKSVTAKEEEKFVDSMPGRIEELKEDAELLSALKIHLGLAKPTAPKKAAEKPEVPAIATPPAVPPPAVPPPAIGPKP